MSSDPSKLLPQSGPARLITEVLSRADGRSICCARIPAGSPYRLALAGGDRIPAFLAIEMGAQAAAVLDGNHVPEGAQEPEARQGLLVAARNAQFTSATLPADVDYHVEVQQQHAAPPLRVYAFKVRAEGNVVASGEVTTYIMSEVD